MYMPPTLRYNHLSGSSDLLDSAPGLPGVPNHGWGWIDLVATGYGGRKVSKYASRESGDTVEIVDARAAASASSLPTASAAVTAPRSSSNLVARKAIALLARKAC